MTNLAGELETVDYRHAHVQKRDVWYMLLDFGQGFGGAVGHTNIMAEQG